MRVLLILLSIAGLALMGWQVSALFTRNEAKMAFAKDMYGFDAANDTSVAAAPHTKFDEAFTAKWNSLKAEVEQKDRNAFTLHLIVIILTALSTLVSTIGSIKGGSNPGQIFLIIVAFLTFAGTITGAVEGRVTDLKNAAVNRQQKLLTFSADFEKDWSKAPANQKAEVEQNYINNINRL